MSNKCAAPKTIVVVRGAKTEEEVMIEKCKLDAMKHLTAQSILRTSIYSLNYMTLLKQIGATSMLNRQFYARLMYEFLSTLQKEVAVKYSFPYPEAESFKAEFSAVIDFTSIHSNDLHSLVICANWIRFIVTDPFGLFIDSPKVKSSTILCVLFLSNECGINDETKGMNTRKKVGLIYNHDLELHSPMIAKSPVTTKCKKTPVVKAYKKRKCSEVDVDAEMATTDETCEQLDDEQVSKRLKEPSTAQYCISPISIVCTDFNEIDWSPRTVYASIDGYMTPLSPLLSTEKSLESKLRFEEEAEADASFKAVCTYIIGTNYADHDQVDINLGGDIEPVPYWESLFTDFDMSNGEQLELVVY